MAARLPCRGRDGEGVEGRKNQALTIRPIEELLHGARPDIAGNALAIAFGDVNRGYLVVDRAGVSVPRDPDTAKPYVLFYTVKRVGGGVQDFDAIKLLKFAAS